MNILFVLHGFPPEVRGGGTERSVEALTRAMVERGHRVTVLCGSLEVGSVDTVVETDYAGIRVLRVHRDDLYFESWFKTYHPGVSRTLLRVFRDERPDVVHVHHWLRLSSDVLRTAREAGLTAVATLHDYFTVLGRVVRRVGDDELEPPQLARWTSEVEAREEFAMHRRDFADELAAAHLLFAPSRAHVEGLSELALGSLGAVEITPPPLLAVPAPLRHKPIKGGHRLVTWGSIYPDKGLETVLDAMRAAGGDWSLQILGRIHDPDYERELRNFAAGLPVTFSGAFHTDDLAAIEADYAVLPSLCCESYGLVLDEAQALGLPVIASDVPAYREHAQPGSCLFFPPGDAASLAVELVRGDEIAALVPPDRPALETAAAVADTLLRHYEAIDAGKAPFRPDRALERDRAEMLFRRAERRLWSALNTSDLRLPPDDFLRG